MLPLDYESGDPTEGGGGRSHAHDGGFVVSAGAAGAEHRCRGSGGVGCVVEGLHGTWGKPQAVLARLKFDL